MTENDNKAASIPQASTQEMIQKYKSELLRIYKTNNPSAGTPRPPTPLPPPVIPVFAPAPPSPIPKTVPILPVLPQRAVPLVQEPADESKVGFIQLETIAGKDGTPIENAFITVLRDDEGRKTVLRFACTDKNGETPVIPLAVPIMKVSSGLPYFTCNIHITADGYYPAEKLHIPVFSSVKTIQSAELAPVAHFDECVDGAAIIL